MTKPFNVDQALVIIKLSMMLTNSRCKIAYLYVKIASCHQRKYDKTDLYGG